MVREKGDYEQWVDFFLKARSGEEDLALWVENDRGDVTMEAKASW